MEDLFSVSYQAYKYEQNTVWVPHKLDLGQCDPAHKDVLKMKSFHQQRSLGNATNSVLSWRFTICICLLRMLGILQEGKPVQLCFLHISQMGFSTEPTELGSLGNNLGNAGLRGFSSHCRTWKY